MATVTKEPVISVLVSMDVKLERLADMLTGAFEGGSSYWARIVGKKAGDPATAYAREPYTSAGDLESCALSKGGHLIIKEIDCGKRHRLDLDSIQKGLALMAANEGRHFQDMMLENDDATTADVFLQLCTLGAVIYG